VRALILQYDADAPAGLVSAWLEDHGAEQDVYRIDGDGANRDPRAYDLIVSLGSAAAAYDDTVSWVPGQRAMLREAVKADVPVLGVCFGSQLLARALGGEALRASRAEVGWVSIRTRDAALIAGGPWFQWHYDTFTPPAGAVVLADSPAGPQAYTFGRSLGVQFHPEVTSEIVEGWVSVAGDQLARLGLDPGRLLAETGEREAENRSRAGRLMDVFASRVAGLGVTR
jgi:GMP synthase-like glutamine amidotransferase